MLLTTLSFTDYYVHANYWCVTANDKDKAINLVRLLSPAKMREDPALNPWLATCK